MNQRKKSSVNRKKRSLRYLLVEPFKQIKLGVYVITISLTFTGIAGFMIYNALTEQYTQVMEIFMVVDPNKQWSLITNDVFYSNAIKMTLLFTGYLIVLMSVILSKTHKVYGPLVSIERFIDQIKGGQYRARVSIRKGDDLIDLVNKLNEMAEKLEHRHGAPDRRTDFRDEGHAEIKVLPTESAS